MLSLSRWSTPVAAPMRGPASADSESLSRRSRWRGWPFHSRRLLPVGMVRFQARDARRFPLIDPSPNGRFNRASTRRCSIPSVPITSPSRPFPRASPRFRGSRPSARRRNSRVSSSSTFIFLPSHWEEPYAPWRNALPAAERVIGRVQGDVTPSDSKRCECPEERRVIAFVLADLSVAAIFTVEDADAQPVPGAGPVVNLIDNAGKVRRCAVHRMMCVPNAWVQFEREERRAAIARSVRAPRHSRGRDLNLVSKIFGRITLLIVVQVHRLFEWQAMGELDIPETLLASENAVRGYNPSEIEPPTYFFRWKENRPFHIDYCFLPAGWRSAIRSVGVRPFNEAHWQSDHRPVVVELDLPATSASR